MDDQKEPEGAKTKQYIAASIACLGTFTIGTVLGWSSPAILMLNTKPYPFGKEVTASESALFSSILAIGAIIGALPGGKLADMFGRKTVLIIVGFPFMFAWALIWLTSSVILLDVARFLLGLATGVGSAVIPMFVSEIAEVSIRGTLGTLFQFYIVIGILYVYCLGLTTYRIMAIACLLIPVAFFILMFMIPESPTYLYKKNKEQEAIKSLKFYRGANYDVTNSLANIRREIEQQNSNVTFKDLIATKALKKSLIISLSLMFLQQMSGINIVIFYSGDVFKAAMGDKNEDKASVATTSCIIIGVLQILATFASVVIIDRVGRKILLIISDTLMAFCLALLGLYFLFHERGKDVSSIWFIPLISIGLYIVGFSLGFGPIPWLMVGELYDSRLKGLVSSIATSLNWILVFIVTIGFNSLKKLLGTGTTFFMYSIICLIGSIYVYFYVIETKQKSITQVQAELEGKKIDNNNRTDEQNKEKQSQDNPEPVTDEA